MILLMKCLRLLSISKNKLLRIPPPTKGVINRVSALQARQRELGQQGTKLPAQPPFEPTGANITRHTDPQLGRQIRFGD